MYQNFALAIHAFYHYFPVLLHFKAILWFDRFIFFCWGDLFKAKSLPQLLIRKWLLCRLPMSYRKETFIIFYGFSVEVYEPFKQGVERDSVVCLMYCVFFFNAILNCFPMLISLSIVSITTLTKIFEIFEIFAIFKIFCQSNKMLDRLS